MEIKYPDREAALAAYAESMEIPFERARDFLLNEDQLESTLARPRDAAAYEGADLPRQAATLFWGMTSNHPFRDGNKRTAVVLLYAFLRANDHDLTLADDELFQMAIAVADSRWAVEQVEGRIRRALVPCEQP